MAGNSIGTIFKLTTFGESHGQAIGGVIDGCPAGISINEEFVEQQMQRRRPGQSAISTQRTEEDKVEILSGVFEGITTGTPIAILIRNNDQRSADYSALKSVYRPSHADYTMDSKYGIRDYRGGGRSSARETAVRVAAAAIARLFLNQYKITVQAFVSAIGTIELETPYQELDLSLSETNPVRCPDPKTAEGMKAQIEAARDEKDSLGGIITCVIRGCPAGLGEPVFDKLHAELGKAMLSINAVKGFEIGSGFKAARMKGSEHNDAFESKEGEVHTLSNFSGGIQGGISNGQDIYFKVAFKPVATIGKEQHTIDTSGKNTTIAAAGRHDPCVVPRAVPIVEAMAVLVLADMLLRARSSKAV
jgi:chorismate synthase